MIGNKQVKHSFINLPVTSTPRWIIIVLDLLVSLFALVLAYSVRFDVYADVDALYKEWEVLKVSLPFIVAIKLFAFYLYKIHKGLIRYTSLVDVKRIFFAVLTSSVLLLIGGFVRAEFYDGRYLIPTSVLLVEFLTSLLLLIGFRFTIKVYYYELNKPSINSTKNILIYGAGVSGLITKRTIEKDPLIGAKIVGFIDDNTKLDGNRLEGIRIFNTAQIKKLITKYEVDELIIAIQNPNKKNTSRIVEICLHYGVEVQSVPNFKNWINGEFSFKQIRKVNIDDLLGREPIDLDVAKIKSQLKDKVVLVTGAAGSIGSGIVRQIVNYGPKKVILLDQAESALYDFHNELIASNLDESIEIVIGDVRNQHRMKKLFENFKPSIVFHAAAYKHVPLMEDNPSEAVQTNVLGTKVMVDLSSQFEAEKFVMISTDKAVNPTNVMGASKRIAEIYAQLKNNSSKTKFITTRFGNVLGSNGSVIPLFKKQIEKGGPVTVTDENVTRYFMTIPEACQLVLEAGSMGEGGEIFVFDMGESVKIIDLAKKMIQLSGLELNKDIEIKITGLRPGEKLYEELLADNENTLPTHHPQIMKAKTRDEDVHKINKIDELLKMFDEQDNTHIVGHMKSIVPEFLSKNSIYQKLDKEND
jgi:FlaA1/EpsC-like NDP-sugar epimerase